MSKKPGRRRTMQTLVAGAFIGIGVTGAAPAMAGITTYEYRIDHPTYGDIGTYVNVVRQSGAETEVDSELRIAVKVLGIVVYRQEASRVERWRGDKLVSFDGTTVTNGDKIELHGERRDDGFVLKTPAGQVMAPASVHPSNPWSPAVLKADVMMSTRTGRIMTVTVKGGEERTVTLAGHPMRLRQYEVVGEKHQFVWFDGRGCPVGFRTEEEGATVDFVLVRRS
jgi:Family of unknown function (DUF6134)